MKVIFAVLTMVLGSSVVVKSEYSTVVKYKLCVSAGSVSVAAGRDVVKVSSIVLTTVLAGRVEVMRELSIVV